MSDEQQTWESAAKKKKKIQNIRLLRAITQF